MTELKDKKKPIWLLVLTVIYLTTTSPIVYTRSIELKSLEIIPYKNFFIICLVELFLYLIFTLSLCFTNELSKKKFAILFFFSVLIILNIIKIFIIKPYINLTYIDSSGIEKVVFSSEDILNIVISSLPLLIVLINIYINNKIVEYISFISFIILFSSVIISCITDVEFLLQRDLLNLSYFFNPISGITYTILIFGLWYTQIAQHIGFKHKIKFDYKPIQKKVAVTETTLEELKLMYDNGTISENEYNRRKAEIISKL